MKTNLTSMRKSTILFIAVTLLLGSVIIYTVHTSLRYYDLVALFNVEVKNVNVTVRETDVGITVNVLIGNPSEFDLILEYVSVRPYLDNLPLIDPKKNAPFLGGDSFKGDLGLLRKSSDKTVTIGFSVPAETFPDDSAGYWSITVTVIMRGAPIVDRVAIRKYCPFSE